MVNLKSIIFDKVFLVLFILIKLLKQIFLTDSLTKIVITRETCQKFSIVDIGSIMSADFGMTSSIPRSPPVPVKSDHEQKIDINREIANSEAKQFLDRLKMFMERNTSDRLISNRDERVFDAEFLSALSSSVLNEHDVPLDIQRNLLHILNVIHDSDYLIPMKM